MPWIGFSDTSSLDLPSSCERPLALTSCFDFNQVRTWSNIVFYFRCRAKAYCPGHIIPLPAIEQTSGSFLTDCISILVIVTPLLEKDWNVLFKTLVSQAARPGRLHRSRFWSAFSTYDYPVNTLKIDLPKILKQRLCRDEIASKKAVLSSKRSIAKRSRSKRGIENCQNSYSTA